MGRKKIEMQERKENLYNELRKEVKRANQRLVRSERATGRMSWAGKRLQGKLDSYINGWTKDDRIKINKSMSTLQLRSIQKATRQFLESETSTVGGIKRVIKKQKEGIKKSLSIERQGMVEELTDDEVEALYDMLSDDIAQDVVSYTFQSAIWQDVIDAKISNDSQQDFIERLNVYINYSNDSDMKEKIIHIYNKYVK